MLCYAWYSLSFGYTLAPHIIWNNELGKKCARCGKCSGCSAPDCKLCKFCLDKRKFGGPGRKKMPCVRKVCTAITSKEKPIITGL